MNRKKLLCLAAAFSALTALAVTPASAVTLPCSTAKLIVPWGAGGDTDIVFRTLANEVNKQGANPRLQVVNIGGQGGNKGAKVVKTSDADGCTLLAMHDSAIISYLAGRVNFTWTAFEPIATVAYTPEVVGASAKAPFDNMKEFVAAAKKAPGTITAGVTLGSTSQFLFLLIDDAAHTKVKYVPYEGTRQRLTALLANNIDVGDMNILTAKQYMKDKTLKALGIATEKRSPLAPDLPTLKEQGVDVVYGLTRGIVAPKGTKPAVIDIYLARSLLASPQEGPRTGAASTTLGRLAYYRNPLWCFGLFFLFLVTMPYFGMLIGGILFVWVLQAVLGEKSLRAQWRHAAIAIGAVGFMWLIFTYAIDVIMPPGSLFHI